MCAAELEDRLVGHLVRRACPACGFVHFRNPATSAAVLVRDEAGRVLMVRRSDAVSRSGYWSLPGGFVDYGEDIRAAARRELREEAGLDAEIGGPVFVMTNFHDPEKITVCVWFEASVTGGEPVAGDDAAEVAFFSTDALPPLAFETDAALLARLAEER